MSTLQDLAVLFGMFLAFVGFIAFVEGVARPWLNGYIKNCEDTQRKSGTRKPLERGDCGTE